MKLPIDGFTGKPFPTGDVVQYYGEHPEMYQIQKFHNGWDIVPNDRYPYGTPVYQRRYKVVSGFDVYRGRYCGPHHARSEDRT